LAKLALRKAEQPVLSVHALHQQFIKRKRLELLDALNQRIPRLLGEDSASGKRI
jgi:hypothetical protein